MGASVLELVADPKVLHVSVDLEHARERDQSW
jgi:hypothetical protein